MKERTDKLDAVTLAASLTGFHVDAIEGVVGSEISNRTLPASVPPVCALSKSCFPQRAYLLLQRKNCGLNRGSITSLAAGVHI